MCSICWHLGSITKIVSLKESSSTADHLQFKFVCQLMTVHLLCYKHENDTQLILLGL